MNNKIEIVIPKGASNNFQYGLVELTRQLRLKTGKGGGFGLGGQDGYGIDYENNIFMMHSYCWCEEDNCKWCNGDNSNFLFKSTDCKIYWYKWIGRSQKQKGNLPKNWLKKCIESIWEENDCWYEFDISSSNLQEGLSGRKRPLMVKLCFNISNKDAYIEFELSPFAEDSIMFWDIDSIISDIANIRTEECKEYKKVIKLDKKYPKLREKIRQDALKTHKEKIKWHENWIERLSDLTEDTIKEIKQSRKDYVKGKFKTLKEFFKKY